MEESRFMRVLLIVIMIVIVGTSAMASLFAIDIYDDMRIQNLEDGYKMLDKMSHRYDADGMFLYIDAEGGVGAVYYGTVPLGHFELENEAPEGMDVFNTPSKIDW